MNIIDNQGNVIELDHDPREKPSIVKMLDDTGGAFLMAGISSFIFNGIRGYYHAARGRRTSALINSGYRALLKTGFGFGFWGMSYSTIDLMLNKIRPNHITSNSVISGAVTSSILTLRYGFNEMVKQALLGGFIITIIDKLSTQKKNKLPLTPKQLYDLEMNSGINLN